MHARKHVAQVDFTFLTPGDPTAYPSPAPENLPPLDQLRQASPFTPLPNALRSPPALQLFEIVIRMLGGAPDAVVSALLPVLSLVINAVHRHDLGVRHDRRPSHAVSCERARRLALACICDALRLATT